MTQVWTCHCCRRSCHHGCPEECSTVASYLPRQEHWLGLWQMGWSPLQEELVWNTSSITLWFQPSSSWSLQLSTHGLVITPCIKYCLHNWVYLHRVASIFFSCSLIITLLVLIYYFWSPVLQMTWGFEYWKRVEVRAFSESISFMARHELVQLVQGKLSLVTYSSWCPL